MICDLLTHLQPFQMAAEMETKGGNLTLTTILPQNC